MRSVLFLAPVLISMLAWGIGTGFSLLSGLGAVGGRGFDLGPAVDAGLSLLGLGGMVFFGMIWLVSLFLAVREIVAEGGVLIRDAAAELGTVHGSIQARLEESSSPYTVRSGKLENNPTIRVRGDGESALLIVRPVGAHLRINWSMWRTRSTISLFVDSFPGRRGHDLSLLRADSSSTLRELLYDATDQSVRDYAG